MDDNRQLPLWAGLTMKSTREEVLAAVEETDRRRAEHAKFMETVEFPEVPEGYVGCVWSTCGQVRAHYGPISRNPAREAQDRAGEEDQSPPDEWAIA